MRNVTPVLRILIGTFCFVVGYYLSRDDKYWKCFFIILYVLCLVYFVYKTFLIKKEKFKN